MSYHRPGRPCFSAQRCVGVDVVVDVGVCQCLIIDEGDPVLVLNGVRLWTWAWE